MNCQDIGRILNDDDIAALRPAVVNSAREHLATCDECAWDWKVHERMLAMPLPAIGAKLLAWQPAARAGHAKTAVRRPRGGSLIIGALIAIGAAAAMVVGVGRLQDRQPAELPADQQTSSGTSLRAEPTGESSEIALSLPDARDASVTDAPQPLYAYSFTVVLAPPSYERQDELTERAVGNIHSALLVRLRSLPHLRLIEPESFDPYLESSGFPRRPLPRGVDFLVQVQRPPGMEEIENLAGIRTIDVRVLSAASNRIASGRTFMDTSSRASADAARAAADSLFEQSINRTFPPRDLSRLGEIRNYALDSTRSEDTRFELIDELTQFSLRFAIFEESVQQQVERSIAITTADIATNAPEPAIRARSWQAAAGLADSYLVAPLTEALLRDSSDIVRLEAARRLALDFAADPAARAALDFSALNDSDRAVRHYARWANTDESGRPVLLTQMLSDPTVPVPERFGVVRSDIPRYQAYITRESARLLLDIAAASHADMAWSDITSDLGIAPPNQVADLLLERLRDDPDAAIRRVAAGALLGHQDEPGVVAALRYARDNDPSPEVRLAAFTVR